MHYFRLRRHGSLDDPRPSLEERFWARVDKSGPLGCWLWTGSCNPEGYGMVSIGGKNRGAHRVAYELETGASLPGGVTLDHLCRVRNCVNPTHLDPVTVQENIRRGVAPTAINARKTHCPRGHPYDMTTSRGRGCRTCALEHTRRYAERVAAGSQTPAARVTTCKNGHPLDEDNLYVLPSGLRGGCVTCRREASRRQYLRRKGRSVPFTAPIQR